MRFLHLFSLIILLTLHHNPLKKILLSLVYKETNRNSEASRTNITGLRLELGGLYCTGSPHLSRPLRMGTLMFISAQFSMFQMQSHIWKGITKQKGCIFIQKIKMCQYGKTSYHFSVICTFFFAFFLL